MLQCSCYKLREKNSISSVFGEELNVYSIFDENEIEEDSMYDSEEDNITQYAQSNPPLNYQEMPTSVCESKFLNYLKIEFIEKIYYFNFSTRRSV